MRPICRSDILMLPDDLALRSRPVGLEPGAELLLLLLLLAVEEEDEEVIEGGISFSSKINDGIRRREKEYIKGRKEGEFI